MKVARVKLQEQVLLASELQGVLHHSSDGAVVVFDGIVRGKKGSQTVSHLEFEAYQPMAMRELEAIRNRALEEFAISDALVHHRLGRVEVGETAVVVVVVAPHRAPAFSACAWVMDRLKESVPIWKKEVATDGVTWVSAHP